MRAFFFSSFFLVCDLEYGPMRFFGKKSKVNDYRAREGKETGCIHSTFFSFNSSLPSQPHPFLNHIDSTHHSPTNPHPSLAEKTHPCFSSKFALERHVPHSKASTRSATSHDDMLYVLLFPSPSKQ